MNDYSIAKTQPEGHQWPTWTVVFNPTHENISHHESNAEAEAAVARYRAADHRRAARFDSLAQKAAAMTETLGTALPAEMARVRDELMPQYQSIGPAGGIALALMRAALDRAAKAMAEGDLPEMIAAYQSLKDFKS